jgi:hypothetical protein
MATIVMLVSFVLVLGSQRLDRGAPTSRRLERAVGTG